MKKSVLKQIPPLPPISLIILLWAILVCFVVNLMPISYCIRIIPMCSIDSWVVGF